MRGVPSLEHYYNLLGEDSEGTRITEERDERVG